MLRVVAQVVVALAHPRWLPPMREWYSGLLPYPVLLPIQVVFIVAMARMTLDVARGGIGWAAPRPGLGAVLVWLSFVYAAGMVLRFILWLRRPPQRRRAWIPIIFHIVLAAFLFIFGSWHIAADPSTLGSGATTRAGGSNSALVSSPIGVAGEVLERESRWRIGRTVSGKKAAPAAAPWWTGI